MNIESRLREERDSLRSKVAELSERLLLTCQNKRPAKVPGCRWATEKHGGPACPVASSCSAFAPFDGTDNLGLGLEAAESFPVGGIRRAGDVPLDDHGGQYDGKGEGACINTGIGQEGTLPPEIDLSQKVHYAGSAHTVVGLEEETPDEKLMNPRGCTPSGHLGACDLKCRWSVGGGMAQFPGAVGYSAGQHVAEGVSKDIGPAAGVHETAADRLRTSCRCRRGD